MLLYCPKSARFSRSCEPYPRFRQPRIICLVRGQSCLSCLGLLVFRSSQGLPRCTVLYGTGQHCSRLTGGRCIKRNSLGAVFAGRCSGPQSPSTNGLLWHAPELGRSPRVSNASHNAGYQMTSSVGRTICQCIDAESLVAIAHALR